jgi:hypothetical protein
MRPERWRTTELNGGGHWMGRRLLSAVVSVGKIPAGVADEAADRVSQ